MSQRKQFTHEELVKRQHALEMRMRGLGRMRYFKAIERTGVESSPPGREMVKRMVEPLAIAIQEWIVRAQSGEACREAGMAHFLSGFDVGDVAYMTARATVQGLTGRARLSTTALDLTTQLDS